MEGNKSNNVGPIIFGMITVVIIAASYLILPNLFRPTVSLQLGDGIFRAYVADVEINKTIVLSTLEKSNRALLKVFPYESKWKVAFRDINNAIDVVWLNKDKKVVFIMKNASSETINEDDYEPKTVAQYVVELSAGTVDEKAIRIGSLAVFDSDESTSRWFQR